VRERETGICLEQTFDAFAPLCPSHSCVCGVLIYMAFAPVMHFCVCVVCVCVCERERECVCVCEKESVRDGDFFGADARGFRAFVSIIHLYVCDVHVCVCVRECVCVCV